MARKFWNLSFEYSNNNSMLHQPYTYIHKSIIEQLLRPKKKWSMKETRSCVILSSLIIPITMVS